MQEDRLETIEKEIADPTLEGDRLRQSSGRSARVADV
jgi:hypothetical protein